MSAPAPVPVPAPGADLRERTRAALAAAGLSQAKAARVIGISDSALSTWLAGKYGADDRGVSARVERWLDSRGERSRWREGLPAAPGWVETPSARRILAALTYAQAAGDLAVIYGDAGAGKTLTARHYASARPNAFLATMTTACRGLHACLERAALACGLRPRFAGSARIEADLVARLEGSEGLLVVDEAQHLDTRALEGLRGIHDATGAGLAILGNELVYARITGGRRAAEFAQLFSRIGKRVRLGRPTKGDLEAIFDAWGLPGSVRPFLRRIGLQPGSLRGVTKALRLAHLFAGEEALAEEHLRAAWRELGGG